jgi:hypothetical protein
MAKGMGPTVLKSNALISIPDKTVYRVRADGDIVWRKTAHKNRLIGRPWPFVAQVVGNRLAGGYWQRQAILAARFGTP